MQIRFLQMVDSAVPDFPFRVGQVIDVPCLTPALREAIHTNRAEVVREEPQMETAAVIPNGRPKRQTRARAVRV